MREQPELDDRHRHGEQGRREHHAVFLTRNGTWHPVDNIEHRWRSVQADTGYDWVTPHTFRKTVATLIDRLVDSGTAARILGHTSDAITREFYIEKNRSTSNVTHVVQSFAGTTSPPSVD
ncbi:tyrosine-type recombinase/integrase [Nocardioides gansuensis]|uniref:tyrosine-type recombinase/integrase n=1 Tax=Nocardioides gansuensis TaxID=2138300 RepID=UPI001BAA8787|nr:tyrosine-type recombinase/integrase [Nocardioides gansuensis]